MKPEELKAIIYYFRDKIQLSPESSTGKPVIQFTPPDLQELTGAGLNAEGSNRLLSMPWFDEMVTDVIETPDMCGPDEDPQRVLKFARDVISEYIAKQFPLNS